MIKTRYMCICQPVQPAKAPIDDEKLAITRMFPKVDGEMTGIKLGLIRDVPRISFLVKGDNLKKTLWWLGVAIGLTVLGTILVRKPKRYIQPSVFIRRKSAFQKDDCLFCRKASILEADCGIASIRCCIDHIEKAILEAASLDRLFRS
jgi:hypothetical protein